MSAPEDTYFSTCMTLAAAEDTDSEVLRELAAESEKAVRQAVASNPNTPTDTLLELGKEFPDGITANPIFEIQLLVAPESRFVRLSLARSSTTSKSTLAKLSESGNAEILRAIAGNKGTPDTILEKIVFHSAASKQIGSFSEYSDLFPIVARNPNTPVDVLVYLYKVRKKDDSLALALAENSNTPLPILEELAYLPTLSVNLALLSNPKVTVSIIETLAGRNYPKLRAAIRLHPQVSQTAIEVCNFVEGEIGTSVELLEKLASDRRSHLRRLVAHYPLTPTYILEKLLLDPEPENISVLKSHPKLRSGAFNEIAKNPDTPVHTLEILAKSREIGWQSAVAENPQLPLELLQNLAIDSSPLVRCGVARNPNLPSVIAEVLVKDSDPEVRSQLAKSNCISSGILHRLAADSRQLVRESIVDNLQTPPSLLEPLTNSPNPVIRFKILEHPRVSHPILIKLSRDADLAVRQIACMLLSDLSEDRLNDLGEAAFAQIYTNIANGYSIELEYLVLDWLSRQNGTPDWFFEFIASNEPAELYQTLGESRFSRLRVLVAQNTNAPIALLQKLAVDEELGKNGAKEAALETLNLMNSLSPTQT